MGDSLYLIGGEHAPRVPIGSDVFAYSLADQRWRQLEVRGAVSRTAGSAGLAKLNLPRYSCRPTCGMLSSPCASTPAPPPWHPAQVTGTPPPLRNAHATAAVGSDLYIFGGRCGIEIGEAALNDLFKLDTATGTWSAVEPEGEARPPRRSYAAAASARGRLYIFGGCGEGACGRLNDLWEFDPAANRWRQLPSSDAIRVRCVAPPGRRQPAARQGMPGGHGRTPL